MVECKCDNPEFGFNCSCEWVKWNPGNKNYSCEWCGMYTASRRKCSACNEDN